jgi:hypothetical protein
MESNDVWFLVRGPKGISMADAILIATAPVLLDALAELVAAVKAADNPSDMGVSSYSEEVLNAEKAIAKAEGRA